MTVIPIKKTIAPARFATNAAEGDGKTKCAQSTLSCQTAQLSPMYSLGFNDAAVKRQSRVIISGITGHFFDQRQKGRDRDRRIFAVDL